MRLNLKTKAVCLDAFGRVVDITDKRSPYVSLLKAMDSAAQNPENPPAGWPRQGLQVNGLLPYAISCIYMYVT